MSAFHLDPATKMKCTAMEHIEVFCRQIVNSKQEESADPHQSNMLTNPPRVVVQRILHTTHITAYEVAHITICRSF